MRCMGDRKRRQWALRFGIILLTVAFMLPAPNPVQAGSGNGYFYAAMGVLSAFTATAVGYAVWEKTRPPDQPRLLNGEFYAGAYLGAAFTPSQNLYYNDGITLNNGTTITRLGGSRTLFDNGFANALTGGVKLGYFTHTIPYLGLELESSIFNSNAHRQTLAVSPPVQGAARVTLPADSWINWTTALHIVGRYGFLPNQEVPFGRLQPYVGVGPAIVVLYEAEDSAKNFGLDVMAGVRYMIIQHVSAFVEYKFTCQWGADIEIHAFYLPNGTVGRETATLDFATHKIVAGLAYHW